LDVRNIIIPAFLIGLDITVILIATLFISLKPLGFSFFATAQKRKQKTPPLTKLTLFIHDYGLWDVRAKE